MNKFKLDKSNWAEAEGWLSIAGNVVLFILKYWAGLVTGSIAIIADAWHTLSDSLSSVIVLIGAKISKKPADEDHPFGHGRADLISAFIIGILLLLVAFDFVIESYHTLKNGESSQFGTIAIVVMIISIVVKEALAQFAFYGARKTNSKVLKADAWHHRSDAVSSLVILVGIFLGKYFWWIDGALGLIVAIMIGYAAYEIIRDSIHSLLGESPDKELLNDLKKTCEEVYPHAINPHHFHVHNYGDFTEVTFHIKLPHDMSIKIAHDISTEIEKEIKKKYGFVATIHIEPRDHV
ncbi:cation diffusion facilitator family transporter [Marinifilum sp. N1E240]|uniref:cation diffusion facilitator family transporter n=1 Tax=Marinifilum sp. N1E240 TaxID=2608082 RepID=UPI00128B5A8D|nr:cation diffusion facilitator family transporter [Marinifilum sp. N1E240]MPQ47492.1 cation diffusion facilitator family transporter [Marinifilum sp. N1E240]